METTILDVDTSIENASIDNKKKRGRKKKNEKSNELLNNIVMIIEEIDESKKETDDQQTETILKKRGRKPKGGKLVTKENISPVKDKFFTNVILHLKCSMQELNEHTNKMNQIMKDPLEYNPVIPPNIMTYNIDDTPYFSMYNDTAPILTSENAFYTDELSNSLKPSISTESFAYEDTCMENKLTALTTLLPIIETDEKPEIIEDDKCSTKDINAKLKSLKLQLYKNANLDKKSACFWCTYDFDNQPCYIPKHEIDGEIYGYGSFCRPECAVAFLMNDSIDDSIKFERYHLLNQIYSKVYNFKKNIKPAPDPHYLLEKFYGNLTIQEYRKLLKSENMLLVVDKPMTRILPELHEDNDEFIMNIYGNKTFQNEYSSQSVNQNNNGVYRVKRQSEKQKGPSKTTIMKENFGLH